MDSFSVGYSVEATDVLEWRTILTRIELAHVTLARQTYPRCLVTTVCFPWARLAPPLTVGGDLVQFVSPEHLTPPLVGDGGICGGHLSSLSAARCRTEAVEQHRATKKTGEGEG